MVQRLGVGSFRVTLIVVFLTALSLPCFAGLAWESRALELPAGVGAEQVNGSFVFKNTGDKPVTITSVKPGCGCTTAELQQTTYVPGESGQIEVTFTLGERTGRQTKKVVVRTDSQETPVTTLTLRVDIAKPIVVKPRLLVWKADEKREAKTLKVTLNREQITKLEKLVSEPAGAITLIEEVEKGKEYHVSVTPPQDGQAHRIVLQPVTDDEAFNEELPTILVRALGTKASQGPSDQEESEKTAQAE